VIYTEWLFFALLAGGIFLLHRRGQYKPMSLTFAYPLLPVISFFTSAAIAINQIWAAPRDSLIGLGLLLMGLPVYFFWAHRSTTYNARRGPGTNAND
jgi:APA family basic amino acid/polyamine antiporter